MKNTIGLPAVCCAALACLAVSESRAYAGLANGSFEANFEHWTREGNVDVRSAAPYVPTDGATLAVFNANNTTGTARIYQFIDTTEGVAHTVSFDAGNLGYSARPQKLRVMIGGYSGTTWQTLHLEEIEIAGITGGKTRWLPQSIVFVPRPGQEVFIEFSDVSSFTNGVDLVLDNVTVAETPASDPSFENGGFESGFDAWSAFGNVAIQSKPPYLATEGVKLAVFNSGNSAPDGSLSRWFATVPGQRYRLQFDAGNLSYNQGSQSIFVLLGSFGYKQHLIADSITIPGPRGGATAWVAASYDFTAFGPSTDLVFSDVSADTNATDLVVDNVRVTLVNDENLVHNGSFEGGLDGWNHNILPGRVVIQFAAPYVPTHGSNLVAFGTQNTPKAGWVDQFVTTVPGVQYRLLFDVGNLSYTSGVQALRIQVDAAGERQVNQVVTIPSTSFSGGTNWLRDRFVDFTAISDSTRIIFLDESPVTNSIDLVLDHIRLAPR